MADLDLIKEEIISHVKSVNSKSEKLSKILLKVKEELDILGNTDGLDTKNNLESFHTIWKRHKGKYGNKNDINSWTAYFLGMTSVKPSSEFLPQRRAFARAGFPDIDTDFDYEHRDDVYAYIIDKYGRENVGNIGTHGLLKFKSCVTRVTKALDLANAFHKGQDAFVSENSAKATEILSPFPKHGLVKVNDEKGNSHLIQTFKDAYEYCSDFRQYVDKYKDSNFKKYLEQTEGTFANFGCLAKDTSILTTRGNIEIRYLKGLKKHKVKVGFIDKNKKINYTENFEVFKTGNKKVFKIRLKNKKHIDVTDEHLIFTDKGCTLVKDIRNDYSDLNIYCLNDKYGFRRKSFKGKNKITESIYLCGIESIEELDFEDVYDISIEDGQKFFQDEHNYIANNIVVHNSHASGIVVSNVPLDEIAPLRKAKKGVIATQFPNEDLEALGLIKFDVLALSTLSVIKRTINLIKEYWGVEIDEKNIPINDDATFELYKSGNLGGVFQCENYGMQNTMRQIHPDNFNDIMAALSLYRPGPMDSIPQYCARKRGEESVDYFHKTIEPFVKPYLEKTYGIAVYQESIMQICNSLAGFSISDGYVMIKAIGKKKIYLMNKFEKQFIRGCVNNKVPQEVAQQYWDKFITPFASYGFNASHAGAYGFLSLSSAYLKANYPDEFITSLLEVTINSSQGERYDKISAFEREFKRKMNIKFLARDINKSKLSYTIERRKDVEGGVKKTEIRPSLLCKGMGEKAAANIEQNQPYKNMRELVEKTDSSCVDTRSVEALVLGGYFGAKKVDLVKEMVKDFVTIREDLKKTAKRGVESFDIFA